MRATAATPGSTTPVRMPMSAGPGKLVAMDGSYANYDLESLGLASREGYVEGGREGRYDLSPQLRRPADPPLRYGRHAVPRQWRKLESPGRLGAGRQHGRHECARAEPGACELEATTGARLHCWAASSPARAGPCSASSGARRRSAPVSRAPAFSPKRCSCRNPSITSRTRLKRAPRGRGRRGGFSVDLHGLLVRGRQQRADLRESLFADRAGLHRRAPWRAPRQHAAATRGRGQSAAAVVGDHADLHRLARHAAAKCRLHARQHPGRQRRADLEFARRRCPFVALRAWAGLAAAAEAQRTR